MATLPLKRPAPDVETFVKVIQGTVVPERPPLVELFLDLQVVREISTSLLGRRWVDPAQDRESQKAYYRNWLEVYLRMGYDYVRVSGGLPFTGKTRPTADTAALSKGQRHWAEEKSGPITTWEEFEKYPWPDPATCEIWHYDYIASLMPEGMGLFVCPASGFLEIPLDTLLCYENLCYLLYDDPKLVAAVFERTGSIIYAFYQRLMGLPRLRGFFQGDDMGFKTQTMIGPDDLRRLALPWHKKLAALAHGQGLIYILHACGNLDGIMEDLIADVRIDGRHSFEDEGNPVLEFKRRFGKRVATLGGIDVDKLARLHESELRAHVRAVIDACMPGGRFALGSGNTVTNYVPLQNYLAMVEEGLNYRG